MHRMHQRFGVFAIFAFLAAIASYLLTFHHHAFVGTLLAIATIPLGVLGLLLAASPRVRGGVMSLFAILMGVAGLVIGLLGMVAAL